MNPVFTAKNVVSQAQASPATIWARVEKSLSRYRTDARSIEPVIRTLDIVPASDRLPEAQECQQRHQLLRQEMRADQDLAMARRTWGDIPTLEEIRTLMSQNYSLLLAILPEEIKRAAERETTQAAQTPEGRKLKV